MNINIYTKLKKADSEHNKAINEYLKRLSRFAKINIKYSQKESTPSEQKNTYNFMVIPGELSFSSPEFANNLSKLQTNGFSTINFFILSDSEKPSTNHLNNTEYMSLSSFNLSEELSIVVMTEQIYRAFCILNNITYHK